MNLKAKIIGAAMGALGLCGLSSSAFAFPVTPSSEFPGLDLATPLPEGVYFLDVASLGGFENNPAGASAFNYNVPYIIWSTPWSFSGIHLTLLGTVPEAEVGAYHLGASSYVYGLYTPFVGGALGYNFGNGFAVSYIAGAYLPMTGTAGFDPAFDITSFHQVLAVAYHNAGWNFTGNVQYDVVSNTYGAASAGLCLPGQFSCQYLLGDYFVYNFGITRTLGKWEVGLVGYGSFDTTNTAVNSSLRATNPAACALHNNQVGCGKQSQFALGGLVGYSFGPVMIQLVVGSDVYIDHYDSYDTRGVLRVIVPLWSPPAPQIVAAKY